VKHLKVKIDKLEFNGESVLKDISFTLNENDRLSFVGPN
jgi:ABC-type polysaccharide/polyol phosphate transport system ATPase subunit